MKKIILKEILNSSDYEDSIKKLLQQSTHRTAVEFALYCNEGLDQYYSVENYFKVKQAREACLTLVNKWLKDAKSVSSKELSNAATQANAAADAATNATNIAAYTAYAATYAANAAYAAAYAAYTAATYAAATYAANAAATYAANAAAYVNNTNIYYDESIRQNRLKDFMLYAVKLYLAETDSNFKPETFELLHLL